MQSSIKAFLYCVFCYLLNMVPHFDLIFTVIKPTAQISPNEKSAIQVCVK